MHSFGGTSLVNFSIPNIDCYGKCKADPACALYWYGGSKDCRLFAAPLTGRQESSRVYYNPAFLGGCASISPITSTLPTTPGFRFVLQSLLL